MSGEQQHERTQAEEERIPPTFDPLRDKPRGSARGQERGCRRRPNYPGVCYSSMYCRRMSSVRHYSLMRSTKATIGRRSV